MFSRSTTLVRRYSVISTARLALVALLAMTARATDHAPTTAPANMVLIKGGTFKMGTDDGFAYEHWGVFDAMGMMQQLGAIPTMAPPG